MDDGEMRLPASEPAHVLKGHSAAVLAISWTKNGRYVMSASQDKSVRLWNPSNGALIKTYTGGHNQEVNGVLIAEDNAKFVTCGSDKLVLQWDVTSGQVIRKFAGHERKVNSLAFGPREEVLLTASHDKTVRIWDLRARSKSPIQIIRDATDSVLCVEAASDEIITGSVDGCLRRYDVRRGELCTDQLLQPIGSISFSSDGECILVSTLDNQVQLLERETGNQLACYKGHLNHRVKVQSSLDTSDSFVVSGSEDGRLCFWELVEGTPLGGLRKDHASAVLCCAFFEETLVTASADGIIKVWRPESGC